MKLRIGVLLIAMAACQPGGALVVVTVSGALEEVGVLRVTGTLNETPASEAREYAGLTQFGLRLPTSAQGTLRLDIEGLGPGRETLARGQASVAIGEEAGTVPVQVRLSRVEKPAPMPMPMPMPMPPKWSVVPAGTNTNLSAVYGDGEGVWIGGDNVLRRHLSGKWTDATVRTTGMEVLERMSVSRIRGPMAVGTFIVQGKTRGLLTRVGDTWTVSSTENPTGVLFSGVLNADGATTYVVGSKDTGGVIYALQSIFWSQKYSGSYPILDIWSADSKTLWAVGNGYVYQSSGGSWYADSYSSTFHGIWGSSASDVWVVGTSGRVMRRQNSSWQTQVIPTSSTLFGVWGSSASDVWAVGDGGTILRWNGTTWAAAASGTTNTLRAIWGGGPQDIWVVGDAGTVLHYGP